MPKIARGTCGASSVTPASGSAGPVAGLRSPEVSRSRTVAPSAKATTSSPRSSPLCGPPPPGPRKVASVRRATLRGPGRRAERGPVRAVPFPARVLGAPLRDATVHAEARVEVVLDVVAPQPDVGDAV